MAAALPIISIGAQIGGTIMGMQGAAAEGKAAQQSALYQAQVAQNNKIIAERAAQRTKSDSLLESEQNDYKVKGLLGTQKAVQAANGIDVNSGTALAIRKGTREMGAYDSELIRSKGDEKAYNYLVQANNFQAESQFSMMKGQQAMTAAKYKQMSTLLGGIGGVADKWMSYQAQAAKMYG